MAEVLDKQGFEQLRKRLSGLRTGANRVLRAGIRARQTVTAEAMAAATPRAKESRKVNGTILTPGGAAASVGFTIGRTRANGEIPGKAGMAVGKKTGPEDQQVGKKSKTAAPWAHLVILGTGMRETGFKTRKNRSGKITRKATGKAVQNRGKVIGRPVIVPAAEASASTANVKMFEAIEKGIARQWAKDAAGGDS